MADTPNTPNIKGKTMNCQELLELANNQNIEITLHLPEYEGMQLIMVGGAITTEERFENFTNSLCHLYDDGIIRRYNHEIGSFADIEVLNIIDVGTFEIFRERKVEMERYYNTYNVEYKCSNCGKSFELFYCYGVLALPVVDCKECKCKGTAEKVAGLNNRYVEATLQEKGIHGPSANQHITLGMERSFTISQIKAVFWEQFHKAGEMFFDYGDNEKRNENCTNVIWEDFLELLEKSAQQPAPDGVCICRANRRANRQVI